MKGIMKMNANNKIKLMSEGKIPNVLLKLGLPLIIGMNDGDKTIRYP